MQDIDPLSPELGDWRLHLAAWATAMGGKRLEPPVVVQQMTVHDSPGRTVCLPTPSAAALHLNAAWRSARRAVTNHKAIEWIERATYPEYGIGGVIDVQMRADAVGALFDFLEEAIVTAMSSYAAIEAFCNVTVHERLTGSIDVQLTNRKRRRLSREELERASTEDKLNIVIPRLLSVAPLSESKAWSAFRTLKALRDSVTHFKRRDQTRPDTVEPTALHMLVESDPYSFPELAMTIIHHFDGERRDRWMTNPMWVRNAVGTGP